MNDSASRHFLSHRHYDVVVVGGGAAGIAAALGAAKNGAQTLLVESAPFVGGELLSGLPIDGCLNARGEWIVGGVTRELLDACAPLGGYVGEVFDWRLNYGVCFDPEIIKLVIVEALAKHKVTLLLQTFAESVAVQDGSVSGIIARNKSGQHLITAKQFVDCSGDGDLAVWAGAPWEKGGAQGQLQPVSLVFRMGNVDYTKYLQFMRDNPEQFVLAENPVIDKTPAQCAAAVQEKGLPFCVLDARSSLLGEAIAGGEMFESTGIFMWPTSLVRREVGLNATRLSGVDATDSSQLSNALATLTGQVEMCRRFLTERVPGFADSHLSGVAPRVGVRETRRVLGEYILTGEDVLEGRKFEDGVAKGSHHIDLHGAGKDQERIPVRDGRSYDIPFRALIPQNLRNLLVAGRCFSSTREANGSARVMGPCLAMGEAAGTAAALCAFQNENDMRRLDTGVLRRQLKAQGAIVDGTH
jgi:hypothetical protein